MENNYSLEERREFPRNPYPAPLDFKVCNKNTVSKLCAGYTVDVSQSGLLCNMREKVNPDDILWLSFDRETLDFCRDLEKRIFIYQNGIIGNVARVQAEAAGNYSVGIRFITRQENDTNNIFSQTYFLEKYFNKENA
jgi:hypothetical protein